MGNQISKKDRNLEEEIIVAEIPFAGGTRLNDEEKNLLREIGKDIFSHMGIKGKFPFECPDWDSKVKLKVGFIVPPFKYRKIKYAVGIYPANVGEEIREIYLKKNLLEKISDISISPSGMNFIYKNIAEVSLSYGSMNKKIAKIEAFIKTLRNSQ